MVTEYREEELEKLLVSHFTAQGFQVEAEKIIDDGIPWRPPLFAKRDENEFVIDVRLSDNITDFWLATYNKTCEICPHIKVFVAIPDDIVVPFTLVKRLEKNNVGIILVSFDGINFLLEPRSPAEREATRAIRNKIEERINKAEYEELEPHVKEITDAAVILEVGCAREAVAAVGRILETAIDRFLIEANRRHKIALAEERRKSMKFHNKIEFLASDNYKGRKKPRFIGESEKTKMLSVKWDRNIGDHPATEEEIDQMVRDSKEIFGIGISMIKLMKEKVDSL